MTEAEWLGCDDPQRMLDFLRGKASDRKLRLFACACCRRIWEQLGEPHREAVVLAERYADGLVEPAVLGVARERVRQLPVDVGDDPLSTPYYLPDCAVLAAAVVPVEADAARQQAGAAERVGSLLAGVDWASFLAAAQCRVLRDIVGNPFAPVRVDAAWLSWQGGTIPKLAQAICADGAFDGLPVLADALEDAGCAGAAILAHCRGPGVHVRGCWVVDLLTGRG
jgi:hypothetical protein